MTYIFLAAGVGSRLRPLTLKYPKSLYRLDSTTTVLGRMVKLIRKYDPFSEIVVVTGFMSDLVKEELGGDVVYVDNPFYTVTNSLASIWFAREYLDRNNLVVINGDIVTEERIVRDIICVPTAVPKVSGDTVRGMSKGLNQYYGEYAGITLLEHKSALLLNDEIQYMIKEDMYDQWYENALVSMIFRDDFHLSYIDISEYKWTEVDCVDDLIIAKRIHGDILSDYYSI